MKYYIIPEFPFVVIGESADGYFLNHCSPNAKHAGSLKFPSLEALENYLRLRFPQIPKNALALPTVGE